MTTITEVIANNIDDGYAEYEDYYSSGASCQSVSSGDTTVRFYGRSDFGDQAQHWKTWRPYLRFETVNVPQGATITSAKIQLAFHSQINGSGQSVTIRGEDTDDASSAASSCSAFGGATRTSASVTWSFASGMSAGTFYDTADISTIIQEIVDRTGWTANNDMQFFFEDHTYVSSTNWLFDFRSKNYSGSTYTPKLVIEYSTGVNVTPAAISAGGATSGPTVVLSGFNVTPSAATATAATVAPTISSSDLNVTSNPASATAATVNPTVSLPDLVLSSITAASATAATKFDVTVSGITAASATAKTNHADHGCYWFLVEQQEIAYSGMNTSTSNDLYVSKTSAYGTAQSSNVEYNLDHNFLDVSYTEVGELRTTRTIYLAFSNVDIPPGLEFTEVKLSGSVKTSVSSSASDRPSSDAICYLFTTTSADLELPTSLVDTVGDGIGDTLYIIPAIPGEAVPNATRTAQNQGFNSVGNWGPLNSFPTDSDDLKDGFQELWTGPNGNDGLQDDWQREHNFAMKISPPAITDQDDTYAFALEGRRHAGGGVYSGSPVSIDIKYIVRSVTPDPASARAVTPALPLTVTPTAASARAKAFDVPTITTWSPIASATAATVAPTVEFGSLTLSGITAASAKAATVDPSVSETYPPVSATAATSGPTVVLGSLTLTQPDIASASAVTTTPTIVTWSSIVSATAATVDPSVVFGSITTTPTAASASGATVAPTLVFDSLTLSGITAASAVAATTSPTIFQSTLELTPTAASAKAATVFNGTFGTDGPASAKAATSGPTVSITGSPDLYLEVADIASAVAATVFNGTYGTSPASARAATVAPTITTTGGPHIEVTPTAASAVAATVFNGSYGASPASARAATVSPTITTTGGAHIEITPDPAVATAATVAPTVVLTTLTVVPAAISAKTATSGPNVFIPVVSCKARTSGPTVSTSSVSVTPSAASSAASTAIGSVFGELVLSAITAATASASTYYGTIVPARISARAITKLGGLPTNIIKIVGEIPSFVSASAIEESFVEGWARNERFASQALKNEIFRDLISANELFRDPDVDNETLE